MKMDQEKWEAVREMLTTVEEALEYYQRTSDESILQDIELGRKEVTRVLEQELHCSLQRTIDIDGLPDSYWLITASHILEEIRDPFRPQNRYDRDFLELLRYVWKCDEKKLLDQMKYVLAQWKQNNPNAYHNFINYFSRFPLWGTFDPEHGDDTTLILRVQVLKQHSYDFLWLYRRLEDYLSKQTLFAILKNWAFLDINELVRVKSIFPDYYEPDIFPDNQDGLFVDVGAFIGDSIQQYVDAYGNGYRKIYAYEITEDSCRILKRNTAHLHDMIIRQKGVGREPGKMTLESNSDFSANKLQGASGGETAKQGGQQVEIVTLDQDLEDIPTLIKMDIEGAEQDALLGCRETICQYHPGLAICVYHGYEDIWKIPFMIDCMYPGYHFYLRHNGGNLIPTEFVLLCRAEG